MQQFVGVCLYYGRAIKGTILPTLSTIASEQTTATETTMGRVVHLLDYLATHLDWGSMFRASSMTLNVYSDAAYLSEKNAKSRMDGYFSWCGYNRRTKTFL